MQPFSPGAQMFYHSLKVAHLVAEATFRTSGSIWVLAHDQMAQLLPLCWKTTGGPRRTMISPFYSSERQRDKRGKKICAEGTPWEIPLASPFPWKNAGFFFIFCALFAVGQTGGRHGGTPLKGLATEPLVKFSKLLGKDGALELHSLTGYHRSAALKAEHFLQTYHNPQQDIANRLDGDQERKVKENRERLLSALRNIVFLARQNIALRGHRDSGRINLERTDLTSLIREILRNFCIFVWSAEIKS